MVDSAEAFLTLVGAFAGRERRLHAVSGALYGLLLGLCVGLPVSMLRPFLSLPIPWQAVAAACVLCAAPTGAVVGFLRRRDPAALVSRLDRAMGARCLLSTAHGLAMGRMKSLYRDAVLQDALSLLSSADPRTVLPLPVPGRMRWMPALLAAHVLFAVLPADLRGLFSRRARPDDVIASLGRELEEYGRRLAEDSERRGLPRSLEIGRALQRLGQEMETEPMDAEEAQDRMDGLSERMQRMQLAEGRSPSEAGGNGGSQGERKDGKGGGDRADGKAGENEGGAGEPNDGEGDLSEDGRDLEAARDFLDDRRGASRLGKSGAGDPTAGREGAEGAGGSGDSEGGEPGSSSLSDEPGTAAVPDVPGPPSEVAQSSSNPESVTPERGEGEYTRLLLRILPAPGEERAGGPAPEAAYRRIAESALSREDVPLELRGFVKEYFLRIGVLGE